MPYYPGDIKNEEGVLEWLIDDDNRELADEIEAVNKRMLDKLVEDSPFLAVLFCKQVYSCFARKVFGVLCPQKTRYETP